MELIELGKNPIRPDAPAGDDARNDPVYEAMTAEVAKLSMVSGGGGISWPELQKLSTTVLAEKSKDMMAACYLLTALLHNQQIDGLVVGLPFFQAFLKTFWEDMQPPIKRMRGRKNAVEWFYTHAEEFLQGYQAKPMPADKLKTMMESFNAIDDFLSSNMEDGPSSRGLRELLEMVPAESQAAPPTPPAAAGAPATGAPPAAAPASGAAAVEFVGEIASDADAQKVIKAAFKNLRQVATYYLGTDPSKPIIYISYRMEAWLPIENLPPAEERVTKIPAPPEQIQKILADLHDKGDWDGLLKAAETKVPQFLFWLDLSRYTYEALGGMGPKYKAAQAAVARETTAFVTRMSGIEGYAFSDETPFAAPATKDWIAEIKAAAGGGGAKSAAGGDPEEAKVNEEFENARGLAKDKKLPEAAQLLSENLARAGSGRLRFLWRMALIRLLVTSGRPGPAQPHVDQLLVDLENHRLAELDPVLAVTGLKAALLALAGIKDDRTKEKIAEIMNQIAKIDPGEALRLDMK